MTPVNCLCQWERSDLIGERKPNGSPLPNRPKATGRHHEEPTGKRRRSATATAPNRTRTGQLLLQRTETQLRGSTRAQEPGRPAQTPTSPSQTLPHATPSHHGPREEPSWGTANHQHNRPVAATNFTSQPRNQNNTLHNSTIGPHLNHLGFVPNPHAPRHTAPPLVRLSCTSIAIRHHVVSTTS